MYTQTTHHTPQGNVYGHTGHLKDVDFLSDPAYAMRVAMGTKPQALTPGGAERGLGKAPFAVMEGSNIVTDPEEVRRAIEFYKGAPEWKQVGMNPYRHSQFYNKETMNPVWDAEEVLQSGPYVIAKRPTETTWEDPRLAIDKDNPFGIKFAKGGLATLKKKK